MTSNDPILPHMEAIEAGLRTQVSGDNSFVRTGAAAWRAVMAYAARPIGEEPDRRPDSDILRFSVRTASKKNERVVRFERQVALQEPGWGYIGRITAHVEFRVTAGPAWASVPDRSAVDETETIAALAPEGLMTFRRAVERSPAFHAFCASAILNMNVSGKDL